MKNRIFYQDFLMKFPYDKNEYPDVDLEYVKDISFAQKCGEPFNLFDIEGGYIRYYSFQQLHEEKKEKKWKQIFQYVATLDGVVLIDDIKVSNEEVYSMKDFYLKVYFWNLKQYNKNVWIYEDQR